MASDILTLVILPVSLFLIMFGMGLSLKIADFTRVFSQPKAITIGLVAQMLFLPVLAFSIAIILHLPPEIAVGLVILSLAPGGATSNMFTYLAKGDVSLSISLTAVVSVVTPFTIPVVTAFAMVYFMGTGEEFNIPILETILKLLVISIVPVALGMMVFAKWPNKALKIEHYFKWASVLFLLFIIALIVLKNRDNWVDFFILAGPAAILLNLSAVFLGYQLAKLAKLNQPQSTSIGFEVGLQNGTLALVVAGTLVGNATMMIPIATYAIIMFISGALFAWLVYPKKQDNI